MTQIRLPAEIAADALNEGVVRRNLSRRGILPELVIIGATTGATVVSLLQTPDTFIRLAGIVKRVLARNKRKTATKLTVSGPRGLIEIEVTAETDVASLAKLIEEGLVGELE
jgi:hypothetical protein